MKYIDNHYENTLEIKQSKFIAHLIPYNEYDEMLKELKSIHTKARHFVVAYRYFNEHNQIVEHSSDDGEPRGTSGRPSLIVLQGQNMINTAVIIVRYFGGTKLGTGGLVRAYSDAVNLVIDLAELQEYKEEVVKEITLDYRNVRKLEYQCDLFGINILNKKFEGIVIFKIKGKENNINELLKNLN